MTQDENVIKRIFGDKKKQQAFEALEKVFHVDKPLRPNRVLINEKHWPLFISMDINEEKPKDQDTKDQDQQDPIGPDKKDKITKDSK